ncbi:MAG: aldehyde dehydrogenase [Campylobacterales bacterium]|nr:aldehyde dehydrogenase [Campylobacterales bacterium]
MLRIAINGVGRIGKSLVRLALQDPTLQLVALNDLNPSPENLTYSLNFDTTYGRLRPALTCNENRLYHNTRPIALYRERDIAQVPWKAHDVDILIDASGDARNVERAREAIERHHLKALFLTHSPEAVDFTMVLGVNEQALDPTIHRLISASTCNATALSPLLNLLQRHYGITGGFVTTVHPWLSHQKVIDGGCIDAQDRNVSCNFEFGRSSTDNIIPTQTTTIAACSRVLSFVSDALIGSLSLRTPTATVGCIDATLSLGRSVETHELIELLKEAQRTQRFEVFYNNFERLVSSDFKGERYTTIIDHRFTQMRGNLLKCIIWYDNEAGYASKVLDQVRYYAHLTTQI